MRKTIISLAVIILLVGYGSFVSSAIFKKRIPPVKKVLLKYHREKLLSDELTLTPLLSAENHPHGWQEADCLKCHKTPFWQPSSVCVNCHGKNGVGNQEDTCSSCHKTRNKFGYPESGNHASHVLKGPKDEECLQCHPGNNSITHANGHVDVYFIKGGEYRAASDLEPAGMELQPGPSNISLKRSKGTCSGIACHEDRYWGGEGCETCHGDPPKTGSHVAHFENHPEATCRDCHKDNEHDEDENSGFIEIGGVKYNNITGYCETKCHDNVKSDKPLLWDCASCHGYPPKSGNHDPSIHKYGCEQCHKNHRHSYKAAMRPWDFSDTRVEFARGGKYQINPDDKMAGGRCSGLNGCHEERIWGENCTDCHGKPPQTSTHVVHLKQEDITCQSCHKNNVHKSLLFRVGYQTDGLIEVNGIQYDATTGECVSNCHKPRLFPPRSMKWECVNCHGYPPISGAHISHSEPSGKIMVWPPVKDTKSLSSRLYQSIFDAKQPGVPCVQCHADHQHSYKSAVAPMDFTSIQVSFSQGGNYNPEDGLCSDIACHEPLKWNSECNDCHGVPPDTGLHKAHLQRPGVNCDTCHKERQHDLDDKSGTIDVGGITYDKFTGGCVSSCHENRNSELWGCTSCHGNPPDTGQHLTHSTGQHITSKGKINLGCHTCHADHEHSYKAAITPNDYDDATVKFSIRGNWDESTKVCSNVGCHGDNKWVRRENQP